MVHIEQRVGIVEARMADLSQILLDLREGLRQFEQRVDRRFEQIDVRFGQIETRLTALDQKFDTGLATVNSRIDVQSAEIAALRRDMTMQLTTQFRWTAGMMLTGFAAIVAAALAG